MTQSERTSSEVTEGTRGGIDWLAAERSQEFQDLVRQRRRFVIPAIPLGFLGCFLGTVLTDERGAERTFDELYVRSETGLGAEGTPGAAAAGRGAAVATTTGTALR